MNDPDPGQSTTSAAAAHAPGATDICISVILHADIAGKPGMSTLLADLRTAAHAALEAAQVTCAELALVMTDDDEMRGLNSRFRGIDKPTNVLSFPDPSDTPYPEQDDTRYLGDVIVSLDTLSHEAAEQGKSLSAHAAHLVVHGVLHLLGYDHASDEDAARMESLEVQILARLGFADPYVQTQLVKT